MNSKSLGVFGLLILCITSKCVNAQSSSVVKYPATPTADFCYYFNNTVIHNFADYVFLPLPYLGMPPQLIIENGDNIDVKSSAEIKLKNGFHVGGFTTGKFKAEIVDGIKAALISPDASHIDNDGMLHVNKWEKLEVAFTLPQVYREAVDRFFDRHFDNIPNNVSPYTDLNPYADDSLQVTIELENPSDCSHNTKFAFFMRQCDWQDQANAGWDNEAKLVEEKIADPLSEYQFHFRFAPTIENTGAPWTFSITFNAPHSLNPTTGVNLFPTLTYTGFSFYCDPPLPDNKGYVIRNPNNNRTLQFDNGDAFFGIGENLTAPYHGSYNSVDPYNWFRVYKHDVDRMLTSMDELNQMGGNFIRFLFDNNFGPEWGGEAGVYDKIIDPHMCVNNDFNFVGYNSNNQFSCWMFDEVLDRAHANNQYLQLCLRRLQPIGAYQYAWGGDPYIQQYLYTQTGGPPYDVKEYFKTSTAANPTCEGVRYYWKRLYKYIFARWGYSTNIALYETFNETDLTLSFDENDLTNVPDYYGICPENKVPYPIDAALKSTLNDWHTDILSFVKSPVNLANTCGTGLGEDHHLFTVDYVWGGDLISHDHSLFSNPLIDVCDVHGYDNNQNMHKWHFERTQDFVNTYNKPVHFSESANYMNIDLDPLPDDPATTNVVENYAGYSVKSLYNNYDTQFHNELWSSALQGTFTGGLTWWMDVVHWWSDNLGFDKDLYVWDVSTSTYSPYGLNQTIIQTNNIYPSSGTVSIQNRPLTSKFYPLSQFLQNIDFNDNYSYHGFAPAYPATNGLECYYMQSNSSQTMYGWIHNYAKWWGNNYYFGTYKILEFVPGFGGSQIYNTVENYNGCTSSPYSSFTLSDGIVPNKHYDISFYNTREAGQTLPINLYSVLADGNGHLTINLSTPISCDTSYADFAFIVSRIASGNRTIAIDSTDLKIVNFSVYPNPSLGTFEIKIPDALVSSKNQLILYDAIGKAVMRNEVKTNQIHLSANLTPGIYTLQLQTSTGSSFKKLIIQK